MGDDRDRTQHRSCCHQGHWKYFLQIDPNFLDRPTLELICVTLTTLSSWQNVCGVTTVLPLPQQSEEFGHKRSSDSASFTPEVLSLVSTRGRCQKVVGVQTICGILREMRDHHLSCPICHTCTISTQSTLICKHYWRNLSFLLVFLLPPLEID